MLSFCLRASIRAAPQSKIALFSFVLKLSLRASFEIESSFICRVIASPVTLLEVQLLSLATAHVLFGNESLSLCGLSPPERGTHHQHWPCYRNYKMYLHNCYDNTMEDPGVFVYIFICEYFTCKQQIYINIYVETPECESQTES